MKLFSFSSVAYLFSIDRCSDGMGWIFYMAVVEEVNDEVDDTLEDYSEGLINSCSVWRGYANSQ